MTAPPPPVGVACHDIGTTAPKPQPHQESGSESDFELDSPPHLTILEYQEERDTGLTSPLTSSPAHTPPILTSPLLSSPAHTPPILTSPPPSPPGDTPPPSPPPSIDRGPPVSPTFGFDSEDWHSSDKHEDPYFKSLVDNFVSASGDVCESMLPRNTIHKERSHQQISDRYAVSALKHYNNNDGNKVKYVLIDAITSGGILDLNACYGHVNFTAKANQENSKEELFFAELRVHHNTYIATCVLSQEGKKSVGGLCGSKYDIGNRAFCIDAKHCYACGRGLKHPKNGALYEAGHVAHGEYYHPMM